ncbi:MAG TPA: hypothetical protein EYP19_08620, partial [Desulfobacterales bacterium]|nr:hypothetical protein [Desulfobacterales bacterium]
MLWTLFCLGSGYLNVLPVRAAEYVITPSITLRETYDDSVYLEDTDDFEHRISPALSLDATTETAAWQATCAWDILEYQRQDELDSVQQTYGLSGTLSPSTLLQLNLSGRYAYDYTFASTLEESGVVAERSRRRSTTVAPGSTIVLTPRNTLELSYQFNKTEYDLEDYDDYVVHGPNLTLSHDLKNERTRFLCVLGGNWTNFDQNDQDVRQRTYRAQVGVDHQWTETLQVTLTAGAGYTESKFSRTELVFVPPGSVTTTTETVKEDQTTFILDGSLSWRLEPITFSVGVNRDIAPSIYGEVMTSDRISANLGYRLAEEVQFTLGTAYYRSETGGLVEDAKWLSYS